MASSRNRYLIAAVLGYFVLDTFDGVYVAAESSEHWLEAGWWGLATLGYLALVRRQPSSMPRGRRFDGIMVLLLLTAALTTALRATLPDALAFRWALVVMAAFVVAAFVIARRIQAQTEVPAEG